MKKKRVRLKRPVASRNSKTKRAVGTATELKTRKWKKEVREYAKTFTKAERVAMNIARGFAALEN